MSIILYVVVVIGDICGVSKVFWYVVCNSFFFFDCRKIFGCFCFG